jgi:hypothetical protein
VLTVFFALVLDNVLLTVVGKFNAMITSLLDLASVKTCKV